MAAVVRFEKVACTGGSGRLGRHVVGQLEGACAITVVDLAPPQMALAFAELDV